MPTPEARRWVFFDIGDTLINLKLAVYRRWAAAISSQNGRTIGSAELKRAIQEELEQPHRAGQQLHPPAGDGEIAFLEALYRDVLVRLGHADAAIPGADERWDEVVAAMVRETMEPDSFDWRQGMQETVGKLRAEGIKMGIISNAFASVHGLLDHFRMREFFEPIVLSYEEGTAKPDPRIFDIAEQRAREQRSEDDFQLYFVDDRPRFRWAAAHAGWRALPPKAGLIEQYVLSGGRPRKNAPSTPARPRRPRRAAAARPA